MSQPPLQGQRVMRFLQWLPFAAVLAIYLRELPIDFIAGDSAQFAQIAVEMLQTKTFLVVHNRGSDYLDKPPLTFWLSALSYAIFGISTWAYKLPSLFFAALAIFSTNRLARLFYSARVAWTAAIMLASSIALFLWTNDVRTDTILTGSIAFAVWQLAEWRKTRGVRHILLGSAGVGLALLTKGPIGAFVPLAALGGDAFIRRDGRGLLTRWWLAGGLLCAAMLSPMLWGLYKQFGLEGWKFYFWTQSFGRITGSNAFHDSTTPLFFTHTLLWELLPWTAFFLVGFISEAVALWRAWRLRRPPDEAFCLPGFLVPFVALSLSHYKLPHYILVVVPLACVLAAKELDRLAAAGPALFRALFSLQGVVLALLWFVVAWLSGSAFPLRSPIGIIVLLSLAAATVWQTLPRFERWTRLLGPTLSTGLAVGALLAWQVFPEILRYESSTVAGRRLRTEGVPPDRVLVYRTHTYQIDFQTRRGVKELGTAGELEPMLAQGDAWVYTDGQGMKEISALHVSVLDSSELDDFWVSRLSLPFLNAKTRDAQI